MANTDLLAFAISQEGLDLPAQASMKCKEALDLLTLIVAGAVCREAIESKILDDRVHLYARGHAPAGIPLFEGSAGAITVRRGDDVLDSIGERLSSAADAVERLAGKRRWLVQVSEWYTLALTERDRTKKFLWSFVGLEVLTHKFSVESRAAILAKLRLDGVPSADVEEPTKELLWHEARAPLVSRFALVALDQFPGEARFDIATFKLLKTIRDEMTHGNSRERVEVAADDALGLLQKYVAAACRID